MSAPLSQWEDNIRVTTMPLRRCWCGGRRRISELSARREDEESFICQRRSIERMMGRCIYMWGRGAAGRVGFLPFFLRLVVVHGELLVLATAKPVVIATTDDACCGCGSRTCMSDLACAVKRRTGESKGTRAPNNQCLCSRFSSYSDADGVP
jgi:hypothetical protein